MKSKSRVWRELLKIPQTKENKLVNSTPKITNAALWILKKIYRPGIYYQKCGVMLVDTLPGNLLQKDMFGFSDTDPKSQALMEVIDRINQKYYRGAIRVAAEGNKKPWQMRRSFKSPNYTGDWDELLVVK